MFQTSSISWFIPTSLAFQGQLTSLKRIVRVFWCFMMRLQPLKPSMTLTRSCQRRPSILLWDWMLMFTLAGSSLFKVLMIWPAKKNKRPRDESALRMKFRAVEMMSEPCFSSALSSQLVTLHPARLPSNFTPPLPSCIASKASNLSRGAARPLCSSKSWWRQWVVEGDGAIYQF